MNPSSDKLYFLGETLGFWIQTGAFVLSATAAVLVIYVNGRLARQKAKASQPCFKSLNGWLTDGMKNLFGSFIVNDGGRVGVRVEKGYLKAKKSLCSQNPYKIAG